MSETDNERCWWEIKISGYGSFVFYGTEAEAEERRRHKAEWEGGTGRKRRADPASKTDREKVELENSSRTLFRARGNHGYEEEYPEL